MLPPPPYPSFKLVHSDTEVPPTNPPNTSLGTSAEYRLHERQSRLISPQRRLWGGLVDKSLTGSDSVGPDTSSPPSASVITKSEKLVPQFPSKHSLTQTFDFLKSESQNAKMSDIQPVTSSHLQYGLLYPRSLTKTELQESASVSNQTSQTKLSASSQTDGWKTQKFDPEQSSTQSYFAKFDQEPSTGPNGQSDQTMKSPVDSTSNQSGTQPSPVPPALLLTTAPPTTQQPTTQPQNSQLQRPTPWTQTESFQDHDSNPLTHQPSSSSSYPSSQTSDSSSKDLLIPDQVNISNQIQLNISKQTNSVNLTKVVNDTEVTEWLKKNTSQSPMTSNDPRWEKQSKFYFYSVIVLIKCVSDAHSSFSIQQSDRKLSLMAASSGETWHPNRSRSWCVFSLHLYYRVFLLCGSEEWTSTNKSSR